MSKRSAALSALAVLALPITASAAGIEVLDFGTNATESVRALDIGADGRIDVLVGLAGDVETCGMYGLDADGALGGSFGSTGKLSGLSFCPVAIAVQSDGSVITLEANSSIVKRSASGTVVSTSAQAYPAFPGGSSGHFNSSAFVVQSDGKTVIGGVRYATAASTPNWALARLNADGTVDTTFGTGGLVTVDIGASQSQSLLSLHAVAGGKIVASGTGTSASSFGPVIMRFDTSGNPDAGFGANGKVQLADGPGLSAVDTNGHIYVVRANGTVTRFLAPNGTLDGGFAGGTAIASPHINDVKVDSSGRVVLMGSVRTGVTAAGYVGRLDTAGAADATFNGSGSLEVTFPTQVNGCRGALQSGVKPVLACTVDGLGLSSHQDTGIARVTSAGVLDATFGLNAPPSDYYPDAFTFTTQTVPYGTAHVYSGTVPITGIDVRTDVDSASEYSTLCNGVAPPVYTTGAGFIDPAGHVCMQVNASIQPGGIVTATVTIGGRTGTFTVISSNTPADSVPDAFSFTAQTNVAQGTVAVSNTVTITGITGFATVSVSGGLYSVGCGAASTFTAGSTTITNGATICVRHTTSGAPSTQTSTTLTVGGVASTFTTTTVAASSSPSTPTTPTTPSSSGGGGSFDYLLLAGAMMVLMLRAGVRRRRVDAERGSA